MLTEHRHELVRRQEGRPRKQLITTAVENVGRHHLDRVVHGQRDGQIASSRWLLQLHLMGNEEREVGDEPMIVLIVLVPHEPGQSLFVEGEPLVCGEEHFVGLAKDSPFGAFAHS